MPTVTANGQTFECDRGANLRSVLLKNGVPVHNPGATIINCRGIGSCGTCAVRIEGDVSAVNWRDRARRSLPPHTPGQDLRLACQTRVLGDISVTKFNGFWGHKDEQVF